KGSENWESPTEKSEEPKIRELWFRLNELPHLIHKKNKPLRYKQLTSILLTIDKSPVIFVNPCSHCRHRSNLM
ncbi:MAG: hypothetical protein ACERKU_07050, partial [Nitrospirota bacterium]